MSTVFRELVQMNQFNPRLNSTNSNNFTANTFNYSNSYDNTPEKIDFISDMGLDDRQKRH